MGRANGRRAREGGRGFAQVVLALLVAGILVLFALRMLQRSNLLPDSPTGGPPARAVIEHLELRVEGVASTVDAAQVEQAMRRVPGIISATVEAESGRARVSFNPRSTNAERIIAAIERAGYRARR
ncbi:MAG: heavy-metal-associated domain-containing protein [Terriglobia bacterium]